MPVGLKPAYGLSFAFYCVATIQARPIDELGQRALLNNRDYPASVQRVREAEALFRQAGVRPAPTLDAEGGSTRLLGAAGYQEYAISYSYPLETGGSEASA
jgi:hypothetical protein